MERVIVTGRTVKEALNKALNKLETTEEYIEYKILEEAKNGFLGLFGKKDARLEVIKKPDKKEKALEFVDNLVEKMGLKLKVELLKEFKDRQVVINFTGEDLGIIIGHRGKTLDALQYLTNLAVNKGKADYLRIILDAEGYRHRREETLKSLAKKMANKARTTGHKVMLEPMPSYERRIIHSTLHDKSDIKTYSVGKDPYRKVIIITE